MRPVTTPVAAGPLEPFGPMLAELFGRSGATIVLAGPDGRIAFANRRPDGERPGELIGADIARLVSPEHVERVHAALRAGGKQRFELGERTPAGVSRWWRVETSPAGPDLSLVVFTDITAERREIERLRRSEALLVDAQGVAHMGTWEWEITQPHAVWSEELYRIYGTTPEEYTPSYEGYLEKVHPDDRARVMAVTEACFKEHKPYSHDERIFRPDGEMRWLHTWAIPVLDEDGKLVRLLGVCQDITEQKKADAAMRSQMLTRALARRLLHDLLRRAHVTEHAVRDFGRGLARESPRKTAEEYAAAYSDMGFGSLRFVGAADGRYEFAAADLLEKRSDAALPTCFLTLGYLEGAVATLAGRPALGNEMRCQSMGHPECRFVVMVQ